LANPNNFLTNQIVTYEALDVLENTDRASRIINREYSDQFKFGGAVLGQTLSIRKPARYIGRLGQAVAIEGITETYVPLTLAFQRGVDTQISSQDLELRIDDYRNRILKPQIARLANLIDQDVCLLAQGLSNQVGTPGVTPNSLTTYLSAKTTLDNQACPMDGERHMILNPAAESSIVDALKGLFQDAEEIKQQYLEAEMGRSIGFDWAMDQNIAVLTVGTLAGTPISIVCAYRTPAPVHEGPARAMFSALRAAKIPAELHVFEVGGHGFGLHLAEGKPVGAWPDLFLAWAATHDFAAIR